MALLLTRRSLLRLCASAAAGTALPFHPALATAQPPSADPNRRERVADVFRAYHFQGSHRTATAVDSDSAQWLAGEASRAGAQVTPRRFTVDRLDLHACFVESGGVKRESVPFFDGGTTRPAGITGPIGAPESGAPIALVTLNSAAIASEGQSIAALRRGSAAQAIVAITEGGMPGLCPSNAASFLDPYGVPVLQVSSTAKDWLTRLAQSGAPVRVVVDATRTSASADNIVASIRGRRPELPPVVVMTPRSGWWQCVSERGGGLACWLETMRAVAGAAPDRTVRFIASSGHELGHLGLDAFLREEPSLVQGAHAWVHLGANIGAANGRMRLQASSDEIEALAMEAMESAGANIDVRVPRGSVPAGEARNIHVGGGRYVSLLGSGPYFHNPLDLWSYAVDLDAVVRYAAATAQLTLALARA
jgi:hypothetical protein